MIAHTIHLAASGSLPPSSPVTVAGAVPESGRVQCAQCQKCAQMQRPYTGFPRSPVELISTAKLHPGENHKNQFFIVAH
jgi:hypothetical protein